MMSPLFSELALAQAPLFADPQVALWLTRTLGFSTSAFLCPPVIGVGRIQPDDGGTYAPAGEGAVRAVILPVQVPTSFSDTDRYLAELADLGGDLVAFDVTNPMRWWTRNGDAAVLNPEALHLAAEEGVPARVFASPLEWMQVAGASGVLDWRAGSVILDWSRAAGVLAGLTEVECGPHVATSIHAALRPLPNPPRVTVWEAAA